MTVAFKKHKKYIFNINYECQKTLEVNALRNFNVQ